MMLMPQHFQTAQRLIRERMACLHHVAHPHATGIAAVAFDHEALQRGVLVLTHLRAILPGGIPLVIDRGSSLTPAPLTLKNTSNAVIALTLEESMHVRDVAVVDRFATPENAIPVPIHTPKTKLIVHATPCEPNALPLVRILGVAGNHTLDTAFIPPIICINAVPHFKQKLLSILAQLRQVRCAWPTVAVLIHRLQNTHIPPRDVYFDLMRLAAELGVLGEHSILQAWDDRQAGIALESMMSMLHHHITRARTARPTPEAFVATPDGTLHARIPKNIADDAHIFAVCQRNSTQACEPTLYAIKLAPPDAMERLRRQGQPGIAIQSMPSQTPHEFRFLIDTTSALWHAARTQGTLALYAPMHSHLSWDLEIQLGSEDNKMFMRERI